MFWPSLNFDRVWLFFLLHVYVWTSCSFSFGKDSTRWYSSLHSCLSASISEKGVLGTPVARKQMVFNLHSPAKSRCFKQSYPQGLTNTVRIHVESTSVRYGETDMRLWNKEHDMNMNIAVGGHWYCSECRWNYDLFFTSWFFGGESIRFGILETPEIFNLSLEELGWIPGFQPSNHRVKPFLAALQRAVG